MGQEDFLLLGELVSGRSPIAPHSARSQGLPHALLGLWARGQQHAGGACFSWPFTETGEGIRGFCKISWARLTCLGSGRCP